ncbi:hypothetical protein M407DRAFT_233386 [Tulasnella calospora MUT 4182]|uniref:Uncharacterized protein n=1 Tax=Tulasnella calospora MUT 4182 TaxID=1051891 RepID=A0A0C3K404_9AGAM|nr:hypothetical protein M407DRAFT_233386 [Tulasnella calospora MUT 4182]
MEGVSAFDRDRKVGPTDADWAGDEKERKLPADDGDAVKEPEAGPVIKTIGGDEIRPVGQDDFAAGPSGYPPEPPPEFSHYDAEKDEDDDGNVFSHDHHLNTDGEAYRFLLQEGAKPPKVIASFFGSHTERRTRHVTRTDSDGHTYTATETYTETITDFAFSIDITQHLLAEPRGPPIWIVGEREPAHRGNRKRQVDNTPYMAMNTRSNWRRKATDVEKGSANGRKERRFTWGLPPWVLLPGETRGTEANIEDPIARDVFQGAVNTKLEGIDDLNLRPPVRTLRDWADEYTKSKRMLKEFTFTKEVYGWNWGSLEEALKSVIAANYSQAGITGVTFRFEQTKVSVRGDNKLSQMLSNMWWYILLWILLVYPLVIWPFKRFSSYGGGDWDVAGSSFALTKWVHLTDSRPGQTAEEYQAEYDANHPNLVAEPRKLLLKQTPRGVSQLIGLREGEWFAQWKDTVGALVRQRHVSYGDSLKTPMNIRSQGIGHGLDGY